MLFKPIDGNLSVYVPWQDMDNRKITVQVSEEVAEELCPECSGELDMLAGSNNYNLPEVYECVECGQIFQAVYALVPAKRVK